MEKKKIIVLGAGLVGSAMAADLAADADLSVTVADIKPEVLSKLRETHHVETVQADLSDRAMLSGLVKDYDLVLDAVPGYMGYSTLETVISEGKDVVDIAFFPEDPFSLHDLAVKHQVTAIVDMGVAPGMSHVLSAFAAGKLDQTNKLEIYVGGLPLVRKKPFEYKAVFSPIDVIEEYVRPARFIRNGELITMPALSEPELMDFEGVGTLEAFNSDGLRSLFRTVKAKNMVEKTLRYPGHIALMKVFREMGLFSQEEMRVGDAIVKPIDFTTRLLFPLWKLEDGEEDITVMHIRLEGMAGKENRVLTFDLYDRYDHETRVHSMARTTGYAATAAVRLLLSGRFSRKGISVPEFLASDEACVTFLLDELRKRGVVFRYREQ
ncbi:MAG TPA: saccharopine dehydrogenase C-terminal domain-containing protein [Bacteroidales bacterium]|nr:saccharopine dehydrogenase C-terminal domain-containing protein [Bacteroidales bacterium]HSA42634.1 saccharopine dehydrogenase C-terminal domain-containing protein [Bacteroidales bacterium]